MNSSRGAAGAIADRQGEKVFGKARNFRNPGKGEDIFDMIHWMAGI